MGEILDQATLAGRKAAMRRLKKILALTRSSTPGEAAAALHQAQTIMSTFGITDDDLAFAEVKEVSMKLSSCDPAVWEGALVEVVYKSLGVQALCKKTRAAPGLRRDRAHVIFVGDGCRAEIASYAFETLRRQLKRDLECAFAALITNVVGQAGSKKIKVKPSWREQYALGWCATLKSKLSALADNPPSSAVAQYCEARTTTPLAASKTANPTKRAHSRRRNDPVGAYLTIQGMRDGKGAVLHRGLHGAGPMLAIN